MNKVAMVTLTSSRDQSRAFNRVTVEIGMLFSSGIKRAAHVIS